MIVLKELQSVQCESNIQGKHFVNKTCSRICHLMGSEELSIPSGPNELAVAQLRRKIFHCYQSHFYVTFNFQWGQNFIKGFWNIVRLVCIKLCPLSLIGCEAWRSLINRIHHGSVWLMARYHRWMDQRINLEDPTNPKEKTEYYGLTPSSGACCLEQTKQILGKVLFCQFIKEDLWWYYFQDTVIYPMKYIRILFNGWVEYKYQIFTNHHHYC